VERPASLHARLLDFYWSLEKIFCPTLKYSQHHYYETLRCLIPDQCAWLDLGCGHQMFGDWMTAKEKELTGRALMLAGIDLDWEGLRENVVVSGRIFGSLDKLPFGSGVFDVATANMVVEHLENPATVLQEVHRVLRPGGLLIFHTPNLHSVSISLSAKMPQTWKNFLAEILEGRKEGDVFPTFYRMNIRRVIERNAAENGFLVQQVQSVSTCAMTAMLGPFAIIELLYLRMLEAKQLAAYRSNLIAVLKKAA
jgi:ubiquinone/menaquinone biosynthesis C-methylase UbiE